jgi:hypothetical protein
MKRVIFYLKGYENMVIVCNAGQTSCGMTAVKQAKIMQRYACMSIAAILLIYDVIFLMCAM